MALQKELVTPTGREVRFVYTNHRGEKRLRRVWPITLFWGSNEWYPEPCWLLRAQDLERPSGDSRKLGAFEERIFALDRIEDWDPIHDPQPHMTLIKEPGGKGVYSLKRIVIRVDEVDPDSNDLRKLKPGGRRRVHYQTDYGVRTSCWIEVWVRWAKTATRAWWDGEKP